MYAIKNRSHAFGWCPYISTRLHPLSSLKLTSFTFLYINHYSSIISSSSSSSLSFSLLLSRFILLSEQTNPLSILQMEARGNNNNQQKQQVHKCNTCSREFNSLSGLEAHCENRHRNLTYKCRRCGSVFATEVDRDLHKREQGH